MPRLNIEDSIYKDIRFINLLMKLGCVDRALGAIVRAWWLAQKWYPSPERMIPIAEWISQSISDEIIAVGLAEKVDGKIRMKGADEQFSWLLERQLAGKKGGDANAKRHAEIIKESREAKGSKRKRNEPSYSSSFSKKEEEESGNKNKNTKAAGLHPLVALWNLHKGKNNPRSERLSSPRRKAAEDRWVENPSTEYWAEVIQKVAKSDFCQGKNDRGWKADLEWLLRPDTNVKISEGRYDNHKSSSINTTPIDVFAEDAS